MKAILFLFLIPVLGVAQMKFEVGKYYGADARYYKLTPTTMEAKGDILFFHGSGEIGTDSTSLTKLNNIEIIKLFLNGKEVPYNIYAPQLLSPKTNWPEDIIYRMMNIMDASEPTLPKNVTGLSLGGNATYLAILDGYKIKSNHPGYWHTAAPVCGSADLREAVFIQDAYTSLKLRIYHGTADKTVSINNDKALVAKLSAEDALSTTYKDLVTHMFSIWINHTPIWPLAYNDSSEGYWKWLEGIDGPPTPKLDNSVIKLQITANKPFIIIE